MTKPFNLQDYGITVAQIHRNLPPSVLYEYAIIPCNYQQPVLCRRSVVPSRRPSSSKGAIAMISSTPSRRRKGVPFSPKNGEKSTAKGGHFQEQS